MRTDSDQLLHEPKSPARREVWIDIGIVLVLGMKVFPAMKHLLPTLSEMQAAGAHIAMVVDEYGAIARVVTVENLVEKLVGDIYDEYDTVPSPPHSIESGLGEMDGLISLGEFRQRTGVGLPVGPYGTVGGPVVALLGRVPAVGDEVEVAGPRLAVTAVQGRRVERVLVSRAEHP